MNATSATVGPTAVKSDVHILMVSNEWTRTQRGTVILVQLQLVSLSNLRKLLRDYLHRLIY
jgi:hypothetical protein